MLLLKQLDNARGQEQTGAAFRNKLKLNSNRLGNRNTMKNQEIETSIGINTQCILYK